MTFGDTRNHGARVGGHAPSRPRLSFCIPAYNRADCIDDTLQSILSQRAEGVEIVIVDGASTDNTAEIVGGWMKKHANVIYVRHQENQGVDSDMAASVDMASGEYCWLMSSDDLIAPDAVAHVMSALDSNDDIYVCNVILCDRLMTPLRRSAYLAGRRKRNRFDFKQRGDVVEYLSLATSNNALFCYMSNIIFRRDRWVQVPFNEEFERSGYAHVHTLLTMVNQGCTLQYLPSHLVLNRGDNDTFSSGGIERRYMMDFNGYLKLADRCLARDPELRRLFLKVTTREHRWYRLVKLRAAISVDRWETLCRQLTEFGYSPATLYCCGLLGRNKACVELALALNRRFPDSALLNRFR